MSALNMLMSAAGAGGAADKLYVDDVFSTYLYTGNGSTQTITNGIDLAGEGGLVWIKKRINTGSGDGHWLVDSIKPGAYGGFGLQTNTTDAQQASGGINFTSAGFSFPFARSEINGNGNSHVSWAFRRAPKFFDVVTYTGDGVAGRQIPHGLGVAPGMIVVKCISASSGWPVYHRGTGPGKRIFLNAAVASESNTGYFPVASSEAHFAVGGDYDVNWNGAQYVAYLWAHDPSEDGLIQCGSFTTDGIGNATVNLGWEPQWVLLKKTNGTDDWGLIDTMRGWSNSGSVYLRPNASNAETTFTAGSSLVPTATGFVSASGLSTSSTYIYLAIRRPNKPPKTGEEVFNSKLRTGSASAGQIISGIGFAPDAAIFLTRNTTNNKPFASRLTGNDYAFANLSNAYTYGGNGVNVWGMDGVTLDTTSTGAPSLVSGFQWSDYFLRRASEFFDVVCDTGTGVAHNVAHNLTVAPELVMRKSRSAATQWEVWHSALAATEKLVLNSTAAKVTDTAAWNSTLPTATQFTVGTGANVNANAATFVTYLFATIPGISKVGTYTGNGSSQNIECGFATGARFFLAKATSTTGSWWCFDSARGIVSSFDPALALNSTAAEVTSADAVDPFASGITVNQEATCSINATGVNYVFLAIA